MECISGAISKDSSMAGFENYAASRPEIYVLMASLLNSAPDRNLFHVLRHLQGEEGLPDRLETALRALRRVCRESRLGDVQTEHDRLFVGLGAGKIIPYACWYRDKKMRSRSLAILRADLMKSGIVRQTGCHDSEDHAGALCEIMAILSHKQNGVAHADQAAFFQRHVAPWMIKLFCDIPQATTADFYRSVGFLGRCFLEVESEFLARITQEEISPEKGGTTYGHQHVE